MFCSFLPPKTGLYNPLHEKDACGLGVIVQKHGERSHKIVRDGLNVLKNLQHRGAVGSDPLSGDGAGISTQIPHEFFKEILIAQNIALPDEENYGVGMLFLPPDEHERSEIIALIEKVISDQKQTLLGWRKVPCNNSCLSSRMLNLEPEIMQIFIAADGAEIESFERDLYIMRRVLEKTVEQSNLVGKEFFYVTSLSSSSVVYKGMFLGFQLEGYYDDLKDDRFVSAIALVHQRYSTNTFPSWGLAQPFRYIAHNGEINTLQGNINWSRSRESQLESDFFGRDLQKLFPIIQEGASDSACFDNYFEFLVQCGRSMEHVMLLMIPEAWENDDTMPENLRSFYEYNSSLMEPWDGPAGLLFTNGKQVGGYSDRNGLRPLRYVETHDGIIVLASEVGVLDFEAENIKHKGRLGAGEIIMIDTISGEILKNHEIKMPLSVGKPYAQWVFENKISLKDLPTPPVAQQPDHQVLRLRQRVFGYTYEQLHLLMVPMVTEGTETTYSMGTDTPLAVLSGRTKLLYNYFKQRFAQVTNPAIDSIREENVMSLRSSIGGGYNMLEDNPANCRMLIIDQPILTNGELEQLRGFRKSSFRSCHISFCYDYDKMNLEQALDNLCAKVETAADRGYRMIILSDRDFSEKQVPIPSLLATSAVHHFLIRQQKRGKVGIIVESGEVREVHHFACLISCGAGAVNPYLAFESIMDMCVNEQIKGVNQHKAESNYVSAAQKGLKKILAKMGISTLASYQSAQIIEAVGVNFDVINKYFTGTFSAIEGVSLEILENELLLRHRRAYAPEARQHYKLLTGGEYNWRAQGEIHSYNPETIHFLQQSSWQNNRKMYRRFAQLVDAETKNMFTLRGMFELDYNAQESIPLEEVESAESIIKRFTSGAMSIGAISKEAHETLAVAMNRLGAKSNTGEGGEDPARYIQDENGDVRRSAIKQVASGRFGVTSHYLTNADELQIKIAQGAKPGEGGQLPGFKVDQYISRLRHTIPGVSLISPPPHHDIYSIEDLSQLIFDLKNANDNADISVKLVSNSGVGAVAAGVAKAKADSITIAGHDGGTGASPATSIKHAGTPWELGLAEAQQVLMMNKLRENVRLQVDGQIKTGRDVIIGSLLGAEEFGFATAALVTLGCIMVRNCHKNTCPVGITTQDRLLRGKFPGKPEYVVNYLKFVAEETREYMAKLGFRNFEDMIGQVQFIKVNNAIQHWKSKGLDLSALLVKPIVAGHKSRNMNKQNHHLENILDHELVKECQFAIQTGQFVSYRTKIRNVNRTTGTLLGSRITRAWGEEGLPDNTVQIHFYGTAGQSFGAFIPAGVTLTIEGDANDYVGKGLSGGKIIIKPPVNSKLESDKNIIVGNTVLYGATSGKAFFSGKAGQRFAVRNSGVKAVVEGIGDHGCEYMTGGVVVILGKTGKNFAAGMSGGLAYVLDRKKTFKRDCNMSMVQVEQLLHSSHVKELRNLITEHVELTGSKIGKNVLKHWDKFAKDFVVVIPFEYRKVIERIESQRAAG